MIKKFILVFVMFGLLVGCESKNGQVGQDGINGIDGEDAIIEQEKVLTIEIFGSDIKEHQKNYTHLDNSYYKYPVYMDIPIEKIYYIKRHSWNIQQVNNYKKYEDIGTTFLNIENDQWYVFIPSLKCGSLNNSNCNEGMPGMTDCILHIIGTTDFYYCTDASADGYVRLDIYYN
jgi:hypothetical protein